MLGQFRRVFPMFFAVCLTFSSIGVGKAALDSEPSRLVWAEPTDLESRDLLYGIGGKSGAPDAGEEFERISKNREELLRDSGGRIWEIQKDSTSKAEVASQRILWALGYHSDQEYYVPSARIKGHKTLTNVVLKLFNSDLPQKGSWSWASNPFVQSRELEGLLAVMMLINNLDLDDKNNKIAVDVANRTEIYYVTKISSSFNNPGRAFHKSEANPAQYAKSSFIDKTENGNIYFHYPVLPTHEPATIKTDSGKWISELFGRLSDSQLSDAFKAGNFTPTESEAFVRAVRSRIDQLRTASSH